MEPTTLQEAVLYFSDPKNCRDYLVARRWPKGLLLKQRLEQQPQTKIYLRSSRLHKI